MTATYANERNATLDLTKGLAIFLVVWGHCIQFIFIDVHQLYAKNPVFEVIYAFHMPLFMALSGYLFAMSERKYSVSDLLRRRTQRLLLPVITWSVIIFTANCIAYLAVTHLARFRQYHVTLHPPRNDLWFLTSTLFCILVALGCRKIKGGHPAVYILAILLSLALPDGFQLNFDKYMLPYFVAGILFYRYRSKIPQVAYWATWAISLSTFSVLLWNWKTEYYIYGSGMSLYVSDPLHQVFVISIRYLAGFAGIGSVIPVIHLLQRMTKLSPLAYLGRFTMGIYVISTPFIPHLAYLHIPYVNTCFYTWITTMLTACILGGRGMGAVKVRKLGKYASLLLLGD